MEMGGWGRQRQTVATPAPHATGTQGGQGGQGGTTQDDRPPISSLASNCSRVDGGWKDDEGGGDEGHTGDDTTSPP